METYKYGPLKVSGFDRDGEIGFEIEGIDWTKSVYLDRTRATQLRDWMTKQIERAG